MRGVPTSRAYWELKADQVLNRVFEAGTAIEVEVLDRPPLQPSGPGPQDVEPSTAPAAPSAVQRPPRSWPLWMGERPGLVLAGLGVAGLISVGGSLLVVGLWSQSQQSLRQERNLLMLERLRNLGPVAAEQTASASGATPDTSQDGGTADELPPPPPSEPWMQELATLPSSGAPSAAPLQVPASAGITSPPPPPPVDAPASRSAAGATQGSTPQLVGIVQVPGRSGSAIFQVGNGSTTAAVGENIGGSGWRLVSASGDSAVIERGAEQRRVSIISGF